MKKTIECRYGSFRIFDENDLISKSLRLYGEWAQAEIDIFAAFIAEGDVIVDAGAYIGTHSRAFSNLVGSSGQVHAFEPNKDTFSLLKDNAELAEYKNITAYLNGLGSTEEHRKIVSVASHDNRGATSLQNDSETNPLSNIQVKTLDTFNLDKVDFLKVDVEGMELEALRGAEKTIQKWKPTIFLEVNSLDPIVDIFEWTKLRGYKIFGIIVPAYNADNFRKETKNIFGDAQECGVLLISDKRSKGKVKTSYLQALNSFNLPKINTVDDLAFLLLRKPQYEPEILEKTSVAKLLNKLPSSLKNKSLFKKESESNAKLHSFNLELQKTLKITEEAKTIAENLALSRISEITQLTEQINNLEQAKERAENLAIERLSNLGDLQSQIKSIIEVKDKTEQLALQRISEINNLTQQLHQAAMVRSRLERQIGGLKNEIAQHWEWISKLDAQLKIEQENFNNLLQSISWRITLPLREARIWVNEPRKQLKQYMVNLTKGAYQALPLKTQTIEKHRKFLVKYAPQILSATETRFDSKERSPVSIEAEGDFNLPSIPQETIFFDSSVNYTDFAKTIHLATSEIPLVSVVIPIYGKISYTLRCLASIAANPPKSSFEIIVIDDDSPDNSFEILKNVKGLRLVKNETNKGFIFSSNKGASLAKGKYLYFLNNDTQVTPAWMDELILTFHNLPGTGLVGSKLIYPDGKLQEAGGIIWRDGSAWNFGRFQDASMPIYNYAREVDYCSGASIMIPKVIFEEVGKFDLNYSPAYCEDSDIAIKIRSKGYRVIYQPLSAIIHYEGVSSGTDLISGVKAYQTQNSRKLYEKWRTQLLSHQPPGTDVDNEKDRRAKHRILVLEYSTPTPNQDAGSVTVFNLLLLLREMDFQVTFISENDFLYSPEYTADLQRCGIEVLYTPYITSLKQHLEEQGERYDLIFLFRPNVLERNIETVRKHCPKAKVLYYTHDLHFLRMSREAVLLQSVEKAELANIMKSAEIDAINSADLSIIVSEQELNEISKEVSEDKIQILPLILNIPGTNKFFSNRRDIIFIGGFQHTPNVDAVLYFVSEIMPILRQNLSDFCFYIVGSKPPNEIKSLACEDIIVTGFVKELLPLLNNMRVSVAPLRYGAGIKGKIGTAMAAGLPVIATTLAIEGMDLIDGENILIADSPESFAKAIVKAYQNERIWNNLSQKGLKFAADSWGAETSWDKLASIIDNLGISVNRSNYALSLYSEKSVEF